MLTNLENSVASLQSYTSGSAGRHCFVSIKVWTVHYKVHNTASINPFKWFRHGLDSWLSFFADYLHCLFWVHAAGVSDPEVNKLIRDRLMCSSMRVQLWQCCVLHFRPHTAAYRPAGTWHILWSGLVCIYTYNSKDVNMCGEYSRVGFRSRRCLCTLSLVHACQLGLSHSQIFCQVGVLAGVRSQSDCYYHVL